MRIVGLFTSTAYTRSVMKIPYLRSKVEAVIAKSGFNPGDHSGKALINVLESYPRDELFQIAVPTLRKHAEAILALGERPRVRVLARIDQFDRFVSILVFVPRDRYDSHVRERIGDYLKTAFEGRLSAYYPAFPEGSLARVHFIIGRSGGKTPKVEQAKLEARIRDIVRTWEDALAEAAASGNIDSRFTAIASHFPESYRGSFSAAEALRDAGRIAGLDASNPIAIDYYRHAEQGPSQAALKIYHFGSPVALSRRVPVLENMGFRVISERTFEVGDDEGDKVFIHDMELDNAFAKPIDLADGGKLFEDVFLAVWRGLADNDGYNALAQTAGAVVARDRHPARLWPLSAAGRHPAKPGLHRRGAQPLSGDRAGAVHAVRHALRSGRAEGSRGHGQAPQGQDQGCAGGGAQYRRRHHHPALPQPDRSLAAHQPFRCRNLFGRPFAGHQARFAGRRRPAGAAAVARDLCLRRRRSRACICASARWRAAACAGPTGRRTTAPRCSAWSRRSK